MTKVRLFYRILVGSCNLYRFNRLHIKQLVQGHEQVAKTAREVFPAADKGNDEATADLLTQRIQLHEKTAWMLRSHTA